MQKKLTILVFLILSACATPPDYETEPVESPSSQELLSQAAYSGTWEVEGCKNAKQAEKLEFVPQEGGLKLKRWQWKKDLIPLFEVSVESEKQNLATYESKDMHNLNPVINHSTWMWMDERVVSSVQWQLDDEDQRGAWTGVALGQFYIKKEEPNKLYWLRWGTTHSAEKGLSRWESLCTYTKVSSGKNNTAMDLSGIDNAFAISEQRLTEEERKAQKIYEETQKLARDRTDPEKRRMEDLQFLRKSQRMSPGQLHDYLNRDIK